MINKQFQAEEKALNQCIQQMLFDASVSVQPLPQCPQLSLYLVEPSAMRRPFSQQEIVDIQTYPAYWAFCWASGQVLAREILANPHWVKDKTVMDFGAGSGVVAIACAMAGAKRIIVCDIDEDALLASRCNIALNQQHFANSEVVYQPDLFEFEQPLDLLIAADVLYDRANLPLLEIFRQKADAVLVADSRIRDFDFPPYQACGQFDSFTVPDLDELDEFRRVTLYRA